MWRYEWPFAAITLGALVLDISYTIVVTQWRSNFRRQMNELDSSANVKAIDSLINFETVKYFGNERWESERYDQSMQQWQSAAIRSQQSLAVLNVGQSAIISVAVSLILWQAVEGVVKGSMSLGDLVMVNAFMIQLYAPLNFLGVMYREIKQSLVDLDRLFALLHTRKEVQDAEQASDLVVEHHKPNAASSEQGIVFRNVRFLCPIFVFLLLLHGP